MLNTYIYDNDNKYNIYTWKYLLFHQLGPDGPYRP